MLHEIFFCMVTVSWRRRIVRSFHNKIKAHCEIRNLPMVYPVHKIINGPFAVWDGSIKQVKSEINHYDKGGTG